MESKLHLGIGHYGIGFKDGVNTVISRNVKALRGLDSSLRITLFGKLAPDYQEFIPPDPGGVEYLNIEEFDPEAEGRRIIVKSVAEQQVHDYVWQGTNLAEILVRKLANMDVIMTENLGIGLDPAVTYAFYLYVHNCYTTGCAKRFIYRCHDFVQQRPRNFMNVKKFHHPRFGIVPNWHDVLYPSFPNVKYISINRYDRNRLIEHGIEEEHIHYIPNCIDLSIVPPDDRSAELRAKIIEREDLDPEVRFLLYPVRCIRRKNVEEAILLTHFFNRLAAGRTKKHRGRLQGRFHLLVSIRPENGDDAAYADQLIRFVKAHGLPVSIGFNDLVSLRREVDPRDPARIKRYSIGDMYRVAELVVTTSILEGFGFAYLEPWIMERVVIGRSIPVITPDFQARGMKLGHLYTALIVDRQDYKDIGQKEVNVDRGLEMRLQKILDLDQPASPDRLIESNEIAIMATLRLLEGEENRRALVKKNRQVVEEVYSQEAVGRQLYEVITGK